MSWCGSPRSCCRASSSETAKTAKTAAGTRAHALCVSPLFKRLRFVWPGRATASSHNTGDMAEDFENQLRRAQLERLGKSPDLTRPAGTPRSKQRLAKQFLFLMSPLPPSLGPPIISRHHHTAHSHHHVLCKCATVTISQHQPVESTVAEQSDQSQLKNPP